jgi:hypothetical protein
MENIGNEINLNLVNQGSQIRAATNKVRETSKSVDTANKLVDRMLSRENRKKNIAKIVAAGVVMTVLGLKYCCY